MPPDARTFSSCRGHVLWKVAQSFPVMRWPRGRSHREKVGGFDDINTQKAKVELYLEIDWSNCQQRNKAGQRQLASIHVKCR